MFKLYSETHAPMLLSSLQPSTGFARKVAKNSNSSGLSLICDPLPCNPSGYFRTRKKILVLRILIFIEAAYQDQVVQPCAAIERE